MAFINTCISKVTSLMPILAKVTVYDLEDYKGGDNPILLVMAVIGIVGLAAGTLVTFLYRRWMIKEFFKICASRGLNLEEFGFLRSYARQLHIGNMLHIVSRIENYDRFINRIAHLYEHKGLSEEDIVTEAKALHQIRYRLGFLHSYHEPRLKSSRSIPINHPVTISFFDRETKRTFTFHSVVLFNNEFFLGIAPPETEISREAFEKKQLQLIVGVCRENDAEYFYDSNLVRIVNFPEPMWYVRHSTNLTRGQEHRRIDVPAMLLVSSSDGKHTHESPVTLIHLNKDGCRFTFNNSNAEKLMLPVSALLELEIEEEKFLVRIEVTEWVKRKDGGFYRSLFKGLDRDHILKINKYASSLRETADSPTNFGTPSHAGNRRAAETQEVQ